MKDRFEEWEMAALPCLLQMGSLIISPAFPIRSRNRVINMSKNKKTNAANINVFAR